MTECENMNMEMDWIDWQTASSLMFFDLEILEFCFQITMAQLTPFLGR